MHTEPTISKDLPQPGDSYVQSFARGLAVIRSFNAQHAEQTLSEVALHAGLTRAGARRILLTLQALGYVASDGKYFRLTARILDLGFAYLSSMPMWDLAEPFMSDFVKQVQESSSVAVLDGTDAVYVLRVPTQKIMRISLGVGSRLPAYCTSLGRVLLAGLEPHEVRSVLQQSEIRATTRNTLTDIARIESCIALVREQGWCLVDQELEEGLISMAAPIRDKSGKVVAAINVSGQANRTNAQEMRERMLQPLLQVAQSISKMVISTR
ncbi:IclR family transcriptional regulator [Lampropedia puyangensis]|uniref:IclR family transcriptional regulator n=1 Tax=Lampropedia puyangensis TaxID=1330072 RepID=A0A4V4GSC8_9BURK|nr:IclR family transcriptional regulator C-terminal domain-containing protein [Lampropedia puyangensis]THU04536.1 IclR family transcriptional regulator [Lampropedia puyangensis]